MPDVRRLVPDTRRPHWCHLRHLWCHQNQPLSVLPPGLVVVGQLPPPVDQERVTGQVSVVGRLLVMGSGTLDGY